MPLRPRLVVLNRLGLLDQVINQTNLEERRDSLINSPSTPPILKEYFILMREKKKLKQIFLTNCAIIRNLILTSVDSWKSLH